MKTLTEQLACVQRELMTRRSVYPRRVDSDNMSPEQANHELACMEAVVASIQKLLALEEVSNDIKRGMQNRYTDAVATQGCKVTTETKQ